MNTSISALFVSFEAAPFAKVGGLADVAGSLPRALRRAGANVRLVIPDFQDILVEGFELEDVPIPGDWTVGIDFSPYPFRVRETRFPDGTPVWLVGGDDFFGRPGIYNAPGGEPFGDELERIVFFNKAVVELMKCLDVDVDVVHLNDYQTALIATYLRCLYGDEERLTRPALCYSIHNLAYQGVWPAERIRTMGFSPEDARYPSPFEWKGAVNLMKAGIELADRVNTVSPRYAMEIQSPEFGAGLDELLRGVSGKLRGILNGIDTEAWNPATDPHLKYHYDARKLSGKRGCKAALLKEAGISLDRLDLPVIGMVGRLVQQKGVDTILEIGDALLATDVNLVALGSGAASIEDGLRGLASRHPDRTGVKIGFDEGLAHRITAGSDIFLMPSRYEPCGLNQMYAQRYGTIPVVHEVGGLADTVSEWDPSTKTGTGFLSRSADAEALSEALGRALLAFQDRRAWAALMGNAMAMDFSWDRSAEGYLDLYAEAMDRHRGGKGA